VTPRKKKSVKKTAPALHRQMSSTSLASSFGSVSSTSTVFGVGLSVLSLSTQGSEDAGGAAEDDDLDLSLFEGSSTGGTQRKTSTLFEDDDEEEYANFHNSLLGHKRNSITKIMDGDGTPRKKNPAPQTPKNIGHRRRPKLGDITWRSEEQFGEDDVPMIVEVSSRDFMLAPKPSVGSDEDDEFGFVEKKQVTLDVSSEVIEVESMDVIENKHVDDLDLDLDMFSMTTDDVPQHASGGKGLLINTNIY
jgi:hypothetical protein